MSLAHRDAFRLMMTLVSATKRRKGSVTQLSLSIHPDPFGLCVVQNLAE